MSGGYGPSSDLGAAAVNADSPANLRAKIATLQVLLSKQSAISAANDAKYRRLLTAHKQRGGAAKRTAVSLQGGYARPPMGSTQLCSTGLSILAEGGNPFAVGESFAGHAETCSACGNDALPMVDHLEARGWALR